MNEVRSLAILGAGLMGRGVAEAAIVAGVRTTLVKITSSASSAADDVASLREGIEASLTRALNKGKMTEDDREAALARLIVTVEREAIAAADIVLESVIEDLAVKQQLLGLLEPLLGDGSVVGSNTSSLRVAAIGAHLERPDRLIGIHFFNPVTAMRLVEIAPSQHTSAAALARAHALARAMGKTPVVVEDSSGYIVNRLLVPYLLDGIAALEAGVARADDIDTAMRLGCGHPMGPLALADAIGLDIVYAMARILYLDHQDRRFSPPPLLRRLVLRGELGKKAGLGIFDYSSQPPQENPALHLKLAAEEEQTSP